MKTLFIFLLTILFVFKVCQKPAIDKKHIEPNWLSGSISPAEIQAMFPDCQIGDTVKLCLKSIYWRNGNGVPYSWYVPQPAGTAYGTPMEFNFFEHCDNPGGTGGGTQHIFYENLFEGETAEVTIVIGWGLDYGFVWQAPSIVCGEPGYLGRAAAFALFDETCTTMYWPTSTQPMGVCPVAQSDPTCPSCPVTPPPDTSNYWYSPGFNQSCKLVLCPNS